MTDAPGAIAKIVEKTLATDNLDTPEGLGQVLAMAFHVDRTVGGGFLSNEAQKLLGFLMKGVEALGYPVTHAAQYVWYLACRYGKMSAEATSPSKLKIIQAAFFSEFSEEFAQDADAAMFRNLVEKLDYNEAVFLAGLWAIVEHRKDVVVLKRTPKDDDYHVARSLGSKGELFVACVLIGESMTEEFSNAMRSNSRDGFDMILAGLSTPEPHRVRVTATHALGRFVSFVKLTDTPRLS